LAQVAAERGVQVSEICHSGILRAQQTAEILARYLKPSGGVRELSGITPDDDPHIAKAALDLAAEPILLVGHLPHLSRLSGLLTAGKEVEFSPATLVCCKKNDARWEIEWRMAPSRR
jgi:phosphohistidine phosphatase